MGGDGGEKDNSFGSRVTFGHFWAPFALVSFHFLLNFLVTCAKRSRCIVPHLAPGGLEIFSPSPSRCQLSGDGEGSCGRKREEEEEDADEEEKGTKLPEPERNSNASKPREGGGGKRRKRKSLSLFLSRPCCSLLFFPFIGMPLLDRESPSCLTQDEGRREGGRDGGREEGGEHFVNSDLFPI